MQTTGSVQVPEQFSSIVGLGVATGIFAPSSRSRWGNVIGALLLVGGSVLVVLGGIYYAYDQAEKHGPAVFQKVVISPLIVAFVMFVIGVLLALNAFLNWNKAAVLYERGVAYNDRKGIQSWRWEDIHYFFMAITKHYTNGVYTGTTYVYTLQKSDGTRLVLNNALAKVPDLGGAIQQKVFPIQYQRMVDVLKQGQSLSLGPIVLNKDGMKMDKKVYTWAEVEQVGIQRGYVSVKKLGGGWFSGATARVAAIPNLDPFLAIVDQIVKVKAG